MAPRTKTLPTETVHVVRTRTDLSEFIEFPKWLYRNDANWIAPLDREVRQFFHRRHPFLAHGEAQWMLAQKNGRTVGRMIVSDDPRYNAQHDTSVGCFGMFECIDDVQAARSLFDAAARWLSQRGRTRMMGPVDYSTNYPCGLLVDGFNTPPRVMMNHHLPYYDRLLRELGFRKHKDLYAWWLNERNTRVADVWAGRIERLSQRFGLTVRSIDHRHFRREIAFCRELYNKAWVDNWGFVKMTDREFDHMVQSIRRIAIPQLVLIAEIDGMPVGLAITLPDLNEAIAPLHGRLTRCGLPIGLVRLWCRLRRVKTVRLALLGVHPDYRRRGVAEALIWKTFDIGRNHLGVTGAELSWTLEDNHLIN